MPWSRRLPGSQLSAPVASRRRAENSDPSSVPYPRHSGVILGRWPSPVHRTPEEVLAQHLLGIVVEPGDLGEPAVEIDNRARRDGDVDATSQMLSISSRPRRSSSACCAVCCGA